MYLSIKLNMSFLVTNGKKRTKDYITHMTCLGVRGNCNRSVLTKIETEPQVITIPYRIEMIYLSSIYELKENKCSAGGKNIQRYNNFRWKG